MKRFLPRRRYVMFSGEVRMLARHLLSPRVDAPARDAICAFQDMLSHYHAGRDVRLLSSGRMALLVLLRALGLHKGDEILVPAYTLRALVELLAAEGYVPVPVDCAPGSFNMDASLLEGRASHKTRAVLATHLFGRPCAIAAMADFARERGIPLIEDSAQALGATVAGRSVSTFGDAAILSFDLLKSVNTFGGGAILTADPEVAARVAADLQGLASPGAVLSRRIVMGLAEHAAITGPSGRLLAHALSSDLSHPIVERAYRGMQNSLRPTGARFGEIQAQIGLRSMHSLDARVAVRRAMLRRLAQLLGERSKLSIDAGENGYFFVRRVRGDAAALRRELLRAGIDAGIGSEVADFCGDLGRAAECPHARDAYDRAIQLPLHEGLVDHDLVRIAEVCRDRLEQVGAAS